MFNIIVYFSANDMNIYSKQAFWWKDCGLERLLNLMANLLADKRLDCRQLLAYYNEWSIDRIVSKIILYLS